MPETALLSASELVTRLRDRQVSSRELLDLYLARIERLNPRINAVVTLDVEGARKRADAADAARARGESWGPLHGLPMTIKDVFEVAGMRTTAGAPDLSEHVPSTNAVAAQRLVDAGAILFGKTNVPLFAGDVQSYNAIFGVTNNPWDLARTPGGSSGGSAAALAMGLTAAEYGSDIGGSIRHPASWTGVYGHKPSWGVVPNRGHIPGPPGSLTEPDLGVVGPMGRSAADLALLLDITAGPLPDQARGWTLTLPPPRRQRLQDYRVAVWLDDPTCRVDAEVLACLRRTVDRLRQAGVAVEEKAPAGIELQQVVDNYMRLLLPIILAGYPQALYDRMKEMAASMSPGDTSPMARMARFGTESHREWLSAHEAREHCRARMAEHFKTYDILLCPTSITPAIEHDHQEPLVLRKLQINGESRSYFDIFSWIGLATMAYLPATAAPVGLTAAGLPVGVQIVGPYLEDHSTIDFARHLADLVGGFQPPPGV